MAGRTALVSGADPGLQRALAGRLAVDGLALADDLGERLDALVHVVAVPPPAPFVGADAGRWSASVMGELTPAFRAVRAAAPALRRSPSGRLVLVGAGWFPADRADGTAAAAVHGALVALTKTLARDLGPDGVTVNQVVVDPASPADASGVAAAVSYLCSPAAGATTGQLVTVGRGGPLRP
ncbi:3-oxoacyl-[acyl-carrier protein] reductase [Blastococcus sp. DSM 46786]|uniref:SDR family oxidoreductase n=1 Tax=Blastococcus sp. DSM 46786 TaxID=1798227 RepID=UPI0008D0D370|nr:SDR family oxidoreductase [Blastococcus sp. DSM 46786]SEL61843.1 3-oxoacyl-[acyl-carrier protein] reductase [Blastococcus sp. DSM 46786]